MEGASAIVGRGLVEILPDFRKWGGQLASDMRTARSQLDGSAAGLRKSAATVGNSMASVGKSVGVVGIGVAAVSLKMASDFQAHTAVLQTAAGETSAGLAVVREGIKNIAVGTGTGIQNLTDGMYTIEKAGFRGGEGLKVLRAAAQGAREENAKLADVTNAMTSVMASYHLGADKSVQVMNAMKTAAGEGKITMEEFSGALSTVLPIASANHIAFEDIAGSMATLTQHGTSAREATHELAATIRALASPNNVASREMARFGLSAVDVSTHLGQRGLSGTVNLLVQTILSKMGPAGTRLQQVFEGTKQSAEDAQIMLAHMPDEIKGLAQQYLTGDVSVKAFNKSLKAVSVENQPMLKNFKTLVDRSRGFSAELKRGGPATQTFTDALKKMSGGAIGLNTILQITGESAEGNAERIKKVGESFHNNSKDVEGWKVTAGLLNVQMDRIKASVQVLAINIGTKLIPVVSAVIGWLTQHKNVVLGLVGALAGLAGVMVAAYVAQKLFAVYTGVATVATFAWKVATLAQTDSLAVLRGQLALLWVQQKLSAVWTGIVTAAQWAWNAAMTVSPIGLIIVGIGLLVGAIVLIATKTRWFQELWSAIWGFIKAPVMSFVNWLKANWQLVVWTILTGGIGLAVAEIVRHWDGVKHGFSATLDWIKRAVPEAFFAVIGWFAKLATDTGTAFSKLPGIVGGFFSRLPGQLAGFFSGLWSDISGWFTKLPGRIASLARSAVGFQVAMLEAGNHLIAGLFHGAEDFFTKSVPAFFKTLWHGIVDFFKVVFGIKSPSTVMADLGINLMQGLFGGMLRILDGIAGFLNTHIVHPIVHFFTVVIPNAASAMGTLVLQAWQYEVNGVHAVYNWLAVHVFAPLGNFFTRTIPGWAVSVSVAVVGRWNNLLGGVYSAYAWIRDHVFSPLGNFFIRTIPGWAVSMKNSVVGFFRDMASGVGRMWTSVEDKAKTPINWVIQNVWNKGIVSVWGKIAGWIGMKNSLGQIRLLAQGGTVGNEPFGVFNRPTAIVGEGNPAHPEFVIPTDPKYRSRALALWQAAGAHFYAGGGILGTIGDAIGSAVSGAVSFGKAAMDFFTDPMSVARKLLNGALGGLDSLGPSPWVRAIARLPHMAVDGLLSAVKKVGGSLLGAIGLGGGGGSGVQRWADVVQMALRMVGQPPALLGITLRRMNQESGGNPTIVNTWDSNWQAGTPSVGLMQVIGPTFRAYAGPFRNTGPFEYGVSVNPLANIYASMRYALATYGSLASAYGRAGGYALGTMGATSGWHLLGEEGPELAKLPAGTRIRSHRDSVRPAASASVIHLTVENHGVIGSRLEVENWLVETLDQLRRQNRLPKALGGTA